MYSWSRGCGFWARFCWPTSRASSFRSRLIKNGQASLSPTSTATAITRIAVADLVMSLDNVIAIAAIAQADPLRLFLGLALSIAMILALSTAIVALMSRFRWIVYLGTAVLAIAAANMMANDLVLAKQWSLGLSQHAENTMLAVWPLRLALVVICLTSGHWWPRRLHSSSR